MKKALAFFCMVTAVLMVTCSKNDNPAGPGGTSNVLTMTYTISGSTITITQPAQTYTDTYCSGDSLKTETYTDTASTQSEQFQLIDNDTKLVVGGDTAVRVGTGSGIQGQWDMGGETVQIGAGTITVDISQTSNTPADDFMNNEWSYMSSLENITAVKTSNTSVKLTGNKSSEVVTITWNSAGDATYTSSLTANAPGTILAKPTKCPNAAPAWFEIFLSANSSLVKRAASAPSTISNGLFALLVKKPAHHK